MPLKYDYFFVEASQNDINIKILIIEDELDICYLLKIILKKRYQQCVCVSTLGEAIKHLAKQTPSIIFLDNHLPDGYGIDFISLVKKDHPLTKIIMITAHDTNDDRMAALSNGADYFIGKPFTRNTILETLEHLQEQH